MKPGAMLMPSHPPERSVRDGQRWDLDEIERLDRLGFEEAWIGEHFTAPWEPCPAPDLLIAQALLRTERINLGPLGHLLPYHNPIELAHRVAYLDHLAEGRYRLGVGVSALPTDHQLFGLDGSAGVNRRMTFESLEIMTSLWTDGPKDAVGEYWRTGKPRTSFSALGYHLKSYQRPHPPIAIEIPTIIRFILWRERSNLRRPPFASSRSGRRGGNASRHDPGGPPHPCARNRLFDRGSRSSGRCHTQMRGHRRVHFFGLVPGVWNDRGALLDQDRVRDRDILFGQSSFARG